MSRIIKKNKNSLNRDTGWAVVSKSYPGWNILTPHFLNKDIDEETIHSGRFSIYPTKYQAHYEQKRFSCKYHKLKVIKVKIYQILTPPSA